MIGNEINRVIQREIKAAASRVPERTKRHNTLKWGIKKVDHLQDERVSKMMQFVHEAAKILINPDV